MKRKMILLALLVLLLLVQGAQAMSSANFNLGWFIPLTSNGGGPASSTNYAVNFTVGQTVINDSSSANYRVGFGYWYGISSTPPIPPPYRVMLPIVKK